MINKTFSRFSSWSANILGYPSTFILALTMCLIWLVSGPVFGYSDTWQLIINTTTTVITFLMLFVLQHTQNRDTKAIHSKLDELVRAVDKADEKYVGIEKE